MLTITLGTPMGNARMAAVPIVVPAEPPGASTPSSDPSANACEPKRPPVGRRGHGPAAIARRCQRRHIEAARRVELRPADARGHGRIAQASGIDELRADAVSDKQVAGT